MAFLNVTEFADLPVGLAGKVGQFAFQPPLASYGLGNVGGNTQGPAFNVQTRYVRLNADVACCVAFGTNPTAVTIGAGMTIRLAGNQTEYFAVPPGVGPNTGFKVAVIASS